MLLEKFIDYRVKDAIFVFWPVIIVFFGLEIIYSYFYIKSDEDMDKKIDILSVSIILIIVIVLGTKNISKTIVQYKYNDIISEEVKLKHVKKVIIDDSDVDIVIRKSDDEDCKIKLEGSYKHNKREDYRNKFIKQDDRGQVIIISSNVDFKNKSINRIRTKNMKYLIEVPRGIELELVSNYADIDIEDIKNNVSIISNYGDVKLDDIVGNVNIENSYGDFTGEDIHGSMFIKSNNGDISVESSKIRDKNIDIYCDFGDITMKVPKEQTGKFNMITNYGSIYDELGFDIIESASTSSINQTRKILEPNFNIRVNNGDIILKDD